MTARDLENEGPAPGQSGVCPKCAPTYCAPHRCYCGHPECPAYDTYRAYRESRKEGCNA